MKIEPTKSLLLVGWKRLLNQVLESLCQEHVPGGGIVILEEIFSFQEGKESEGETPLKCWKVIIG